MRCFAMLALAVGGVLPGLAHAQAAPARQQGFAFCTVSDTSHAQATIWASPVVTVAYGAEDPGGFRRSMELASEFLAHVGTLGGRGDKGCSMSTTPAEAAALREEQRAIWDKRVYFVKIGDWRETTWTPAPFAPVAEVASAAPVTRHFLCQATQTDIPDRSDRSRTVTSGVFTMPVPGTRTQEAMYQQASAYGIEFQSVVQAHGLPVQGSCMPYDTAGEAQYAYQQLVRFSKSFNMKYSEVAWLPRGQPATTVMAATTPTPAATAPANRGTLGVRIDAVSPELAQGLGLPSTQGAWVVEVLPGSAAMQAGVKPMDVVVEIAGEAVVSPADLPGAVGRLQPGVGTTLRVWRERRMQDLVVTLPGRAAHDDTPAPATPQVAVADTTPTVTAAAPDHYYCVAQVSTTRAPPIVLHAPVRQFAGAPADTGALASTLTKLLGTVQASGSGWRAFDGVKCFPNDAVFPGETFCFATAIKRLRNITQLGALFCNASREQTERRWQDMQNAAGAVATPLAWP